MGFSLVAHEGPSAQSIAFGSITSSYTTLLSNLTGCAILSLWNTTDQDIFVTWDNGLYDAVLLPPGGFQQLNFGANGLILNSISSIKAKYASVAPTTGAIYASAVRRDS